MKRRRREVFEQSLLLLLFPSALGPFCSFPLLLPEIYVNNLSAQYDDSVSPPKGGRRRIRQTASFVMQDD